MVKLEIKISEDKKMNVGSIEAIGCTCEFNIKGILPTKSEVEAAEVLKKKIGCDKGYEIINNSGVSNEKILNELFEKL